MAFRLLAPIFHPPLISTVLPLLVKTKREWLISGLVIVRGFCLFLSPPLVSFRVISAIRGGDYPGLARPGTGFTPGVGDPVQLRELTWL